VVLQDIGGREVRERLSALRPRLRVVFMYGYTEDAVLRQRLLQRGVTLLLKPFTAHSLAATLREALGAAEVG
jgi:FixJ family two-component response regulator